MASSCSPGDIETKSRPIPGVTKPDVSTAKFRETALSLLSAWPDYFRQLAQPDRYLSVEKKFYASGRPKPDLITIEEAGCDITTQSNCYSSPRLELPAEVFAYFVQNTMIYQDGPEDNDHRSIFRLTSDALQIAHELATGDIKQGNDGGLSGGKLVTLRRYKLF